MRTVLLVILVGCASSDTTPAPAPVEPKTPYGAPLPDRENQGRTIFGGLDDLGTSTDHYWVSAAAHTATGNPVTVTVDGAALRVDEAGLIYAGDDPRIVGITFVGGDGTSLTITGVQKADAEEPIRYFLSHDGSDPCDGEGAIALAGRVTVDARHVATAGELSFACEKGVAYKCTKWHYVAGDTAGSEAWDLHQTCMYMAGARYCVDRRTFTREGTEVAMFDRPGVRVAFPPDWVPASTWTPWQLDTWPPPHDEFYVEAAWRPNGVPLCLSKARWASLPEAPCGAALPDPRVDQSAQYCEQLLDEGVLTPNDVLIVNTSLYNDIAFDLWRTVGGDLLGTVRGFRDEDAGGTHSMPPFGQMQYVGHSGVLLRALTSTLDPADVQLLEMFCVPTTNKCVVTLPGSLPAMTTHSQSRGVEGYAFIAQRPGTIPLRLWYDSATDDYVSSVAQPAGYAHVADLGWILQRGN